MTLLQQKIIALGGNKKNGVKDLNNAKSKSYDDIFNSSLSYAGRLSEHHQEIITVVLPNSIEYIEILLACILTGNIFNPIPFFTSDEELERILKYINPKILISTKEFSDKPKLKGLAVKPNEFSKSSAEFNPLSEAKIIGSEIAALYYSSGTTGSPKGVLYSHDNIFYLIKSINKGFGFNKDTKHLAILPFGHTASINYNIFPCLFNCSNLVIAESFSAIAPKFFKILSDEKINYTQLVPTVVYMLLKIKYELKGINLNLLLFIGCGSSILPIETQTQFQEKFGIKIGNLYGLSETGPSHIDDPRIDNWSPGSIGVPLDVNECKLSKNSELLIKGKNVFSGYYKNESLYNEVVKNGWFNTGDLVEYKNGLYVFKDRSKDLIIKGGINIVPAEVEEIIYMHKGIFEVAVVGIANDIHGEEVIAGVSIKDDFQEKNNIKSELYELLSKSLSSYKHPIDILFFESLPKTHSGKLKRMEVKRIIEDEYNR